MSWFASLSCLAVSWSCKLVRQRCTASLHNSTLWRRIRWLSSLGVSGRVSVVGDGMAAPSWWQASTKSERFSWCHTVNMPRFFKHHVLCRHPFCTQRYEKTRVFVQSSSQDCTSTTRRPRASSTHCLPPSFPCQGSFRYGNLCIGPRLTRDHPEKQPHID